MVLYVSALVIEYIAVSPFVLGGDKSLKNKNVNKNLQKDQPKLILTPFWIFF